MKYIKTVFINKVLLGDSPVYSFSYFSLPVSSTTVAFVIPETAQSTKPKVFV